MNLKEKLRKIEHNILSLKENEGTFTLAQLANDLFHRRYNNAIFKILIQFYGFFRAQPFQYVSQVDQNTDVPLAFVLSNFKR